MKKQKTFRKMTLLLVKESGNHWFYSAFKTLRDVASENRDTFIEKGFNKPLLYEFINNPRIVELGLLLRIVDWCDIDDNIETIDDTLDIKSSINWLKTYFGWTLAEKWKNALQKNEILITSNMEDYRIETEWFTVDDWDNKFMELLQS